MCAIVQAGAHAKYAGDKCVLKKVFTMGLSVNLEIPRAEPYDLHQHPKMNGLLHNWKDGNGNSFCF